MAPASEEGRSLAARALLPLLALLCLFPFATAPLALLAGVAVALLFGNPHAARTKPLVPRLLALSVVGLGAGMDLRVVSRAGLAGIGYTVVGLSLTLALGHLLGRLLATRPNASLLISVGTAICGGSAIAAVAPAIRAEEEDVSVSLGTVFLLNALALFLFPPIGRSLGLSEPAFGLWAALAIHDTSSVVGAALSYGGAALAVATSVKLARALWIVPLTLAIGAWRARSGREAGASKPKRPWFVLGFLAAAALATFVPGLREPGALLSAIAKKGLVVTLLLIGSGLSRDALRRVGWRPFAQGTALWAITASLTLAAIASGLVRP